MTKSPRAGQVKTRLIPPLTPAEAAALNICFLRDTALAIARVEEAAQGVGCYTPVGDENIYADILPADFQLIAQRGASLEERIVGAIEDLLIFGFSSVCLINSDSPTLTTASLAEAVRILSLPQAGLVMGPADDGGYYLIGVSAPLPPLFEGIDWSTERVLDQTLQRASELALKVSLLPDCYDVDDRATLHRLCGELLGDDGIDSIAPFTQEFLRAIVAREGRDRIWPEELSRQ